jgi:hypothetical protein
MRAAALVLAGTLAAGLLLVPSAAAQDDLCQSPEVSLGDVGGLFGPGEVRTLVVTVTNPNDREATAEVEVETPDGWEGGGSQSGVSVPGGGSTDVEVTLTAPEEGGSGGTLKATANLTCGSPPLAAPSSASTASADLAFESPGLPWGLIAAGVVGLAAVGGGVVAYQRRETGLEADCPQPVQEVAPGGRTGFELAVENALDSPDTASIRIQDPPPGWKAFATVDEVELGPSEVRNPTVAVVAPDDAAPGDSARVGIDVTSERSGETASVPVRVDVVADPDAERSAGPNLGEEQHA